MWKITEKKNGGKEQRGVSSNYRKSKPFEESEKIEESVCEEHGFLRHAMQDAHLFFSFVGTPTILHKKLLF